MGVSGSFNVRATDIEGVINALMKELASLAPAAKNPGHSTPHLTSGVSCSGLFNTQSGVETMVGLCFSNMPQRLGLEASIAQLIRKLYSVRKNAYRLSLASLCL